MRDSITGLEFDPAVPLTGYEPDPVWRTEPVTPFLSDADSEQVFKQPVAPNQKYPTRNPEPA